MASSKSASKPGFKDMILQAIKTLEDKKGSSRYAIKKYILSHYDVSDHAFNYRLNKTFKKLVDTQTLIHPKSSKGLFKINKVELNKIERDEKAKAKAALKVEKERQKKVSKAKSGVKSTAQKTKTTKKVAPKKADKKTPQKKTTKTKKVTKKTPKKPVAKKATKKPATKKTPKKTAKKPAAKKTTGAKKTTKK